MFTVFSWNLDYSSIIEALRAGDSWMFEDDDGSKVFIHHLNEDNRDSAWLLYGEQWLEADIILCCNPQWLPESFRVKHPFPSHQGRVQLNFTTTRVLASVA